MRTKIRIHGLARIHARLRGVSRSTDQTERLLLHIGLLKITYIRRKFLTGGPGWKPLSWPYLQRLRRQGIIRDPSRPLVLTGALMRSIQIRELSRDHLRLATNIPYAPVHNFGGRAGQANQFRSWHIPKRQFMAWTRKDRRMTVRRYRQHIQKGMGNPAWS